MKVRILSRNPNNFQRFIFEQFINSSCQHIVHNSGTQDYRLQVVCGIWIRQKKILVARRAPHKPESGIWEFPGGKIGAGETPEIALIREWKEELSVTITVQEHIHTVNYEQLDLHAFRISGASNPTHSTDHDLIFWSPLPLLKSINLGRADSLLLDYLARWVD